MNIKSTTFVIFILFFTYVSSIKVKQFANRFYAYFKNGVFSIDNLNTCNKDPTILPTFDCSKKGVWKHGVNYKVGDDITVDYAIYQIINTSIYKPNYQGDVCITRDDCILKKKSYMLKGSCRSSNVKTTVSFSKKGTVSADF